MNQQMSEAWGQGQRSEDSDGADGNHDNDVLHVVNLDTLESDAVADITHKHSHLDDTHDSPNRPSSTSITALTPEDPPPGHIGSLRNGRTPSRSLDGAFDVILVRDGGDDSAMGVKGQRPHAQKQEATVGTVSTSTLIDAHRVAEAMVTRVLHAAVLNFVGVRRKSCACVIQRAFRAHLAREIACGERWWERAREKRVWHARKVPGVRPTDPLPFPADFLPLRAETKGPNGIDPKAYAFEPRVGGRWATDPFRLRAYDKLSNVPETRGDYTVRRDVRERCWALLANYEASDTLRTALGEWERQSSWSDENPRGFPPGWKDMFVISPNHFFMYRSDAWGNVVALTAHGGKALTAFAVDHIFPVARGGRNHTMNTMGLHWGANGFKTDKIINRIPPESTEWRELGCGLQVDDLIALGEAIVHDTVDAKWEAVDFVLRRQELPVAGNSRSFQTLLARHTSHATHGARVWAALCDLRDMREMDCGLFRPGSLEARWRDAREAAGLPTHVRVLVDRGQLSAGDVHPARGWEITDEKPVNWVGSAQERFQLAHFCVHDGKKGGLALVLWGACANAPHSVDGSRGNYNWEWCDSNN